MKVLHAETVKGRGIVARVDASEIPRGGLRVGILVHQGELAWKLVGVSTPRPPPPQGQVDLLLRPDGQHELVPATGALLL